MGVFVGGPFVGEQGAGFEGEGLPGEKGVQMVAHFTIRVALYEEVDVAGGIGVADGGVGSQDGEPGAGWGGFC